MGETEKKVVPWWFFALFIGVGVIMLAVGALWIGKVNKFLASAVEAQGVIVDISAHQDIDDDQMMYSAIIEFTAADGETYQFTVGNSSSIKPKLGKQVGVLYDPAHPQDADRQGFWNQWLGPVIFLGLGGVFFILGLVLWIKLRGKPIAVSDSNVDFMMDD